VALAALGSAGNYYTDTTLAAAQTSAEGALSEGDTYAATGDDVGYVGVYEVTSGPDSTELWRVPTAAAVDVLADQAKQYENGSDDLESLSGRATIAQSTANIAEWSFDDATTSTIKFSRNSGSGAGGFVAVGTAIVDSIGETEVSAEFSLLSGTTTNAGAGFCFGSGNDRLYVYCTSGGVVARADKDATAVVIESANSVLAYIATEVFALSVAIAADRQSAALTVTGPDGDGLTYSIATPIPAGPVFVAARLSSGAVMACSSFTWRGVVARLNDRIEAVAPEDAYVRVAGPVSTPATGSDNSASTFMYGDPIALTGELRVEIFGGTVGGIVYVKRFDAETRIQIGSDILVPGVRAAALRTFDTGVVVNAGECLGFHAPAGSVAFIGGSAESGGYLNNSGNVSTITDTSLSTNGQLQVRFSVRRDAHTRLDAADEKIASLTARGAVWIPVAGIDVPKVGAGTVAAGIYGFRDAVRVGGPLKIKGIGGPSDGTIRFRRMAISGDTFKQVGPDIVVTTVANTPFAHTSDDIIEVGQTLHWYVTDSALAYSGGKGPRTGWVNSSGNVTSFTDASGSTTGAFELKVSVLAAPPRPCSATGKRIAVFGTSIEEYSDWPRQTGELIGADVMNFGIGGSRTSANYGVNPIIAYSLVPIAESIASGDWTTIKAAALAALTGGTDDVHRQVYQASEVDWSEVDAILLCYGTNDWSSETPLGTSASITDDGTFYGALNYSIEIIQEAFPNIQIVLATPLWRTAPADADTNANGAGVFLSEYVDVVLDVARAHKLPVLDAYRESGINKFNHAAYLDDGTHPTAAGFSRLASMYAAFLGRTIY
jgi:lysophospholipase L1-like esterase